MLRYWGILDAATSLSQEQDFLALWDGNLINIMRYIPATTETFLFKGIFTEIFPKYDAKTESAKYSAINFIVWGLSGTIPAMIFYPLNYVRHRLEMQIGETKEFIGIRDCISKTIDGPDGYSGLYTGFRTNILGCFIYRGLYFSAYEYLNEKNPYKRERSLRGTLSRYAIGQIVAISAAFVTYPLDTISNRLQLLADRPLKYRYYSGAIDCAQQIVQDEGVGGFFEGFGANILRSLVTSSVIVAYDEIVGRWEREKQNEKGE